LKLIKEHRTPIVRAKQRLRIAIDMDETIADSLKEHIRRYNAEFAEAMTAESLYGKHIKDVVPADRADAVRRIPCNEGFFDCLDVITDAREVLHELAREHELFIVSAAMEIPGSFASKYRWLRRHLPFVPASNIVFCWDKGIIDADYLIDDEPRHFRTFRGTGILFSAPHNLDEKTYERVSSWQEIRRKFLEPARTAFSTNHDISDLVSQANLSSEITTTTDQGE
jgi:5'(3')-deoxyribonucleotidase